MRRNNGQYAKGTTGNPLGRPKRADEQFLIDLWETHGQKQFSNAIEKGEQWALKVLVDKLYPNQKPLNIQFEMPTQIPCSMTEEHKERLLSLIAT